MMDNFVPNKNSTLTFTANAISQSFALPVGGGLFCRVENAGANIAFAELSSDANLTASVPTANAPGGFPVFANQPALLVKLHPTDTRIALISAGSSTVYVTRGDTL
jgi:hypothetical protein